MTRVCSHFDFDGRPPDLLREPASHIHYITYSRLTASKWFGGRCGDEHGKSCLLFALDFVQYMRCNFLSPFPLCPSNSNPKFTINSSHNSPFITTKLSWFAMAFQWSKNHHHAGGPHHARRDCPVHFHRRPQQALHQSGHRGKPHTLRGITAAILHVN